MRTLINKKIFKKNDRMSKLNATLMLKIVINQIDSNTEYTLNINLFILQTLFNFKLKEKIDFKINLL